MKKIVARPSRQIANSPKRKCSRGASSICIIEKEIYTEADIAEIKESLAEIKRGEYHTHDEVMRDAGLRN